MTRNIYIYICFFFIFILSSRSSAVMRAFTTEELTKGSEAVITGVIDDIESFWATSNGRKTIITRVKVNLIEVIRGSLPQESLFVEYEGGQVGDIVLEVSDMEPFTKGEEVILFLNKATMLRNPVDSNIKSASAADNIYYIKGKAQGKYVVNKDSVAIKKGYSVADEKNGADKVIKKDILIDKIRSIR